MATLKLTLEKQATPVDEIKPRQDTSALTEGLIELAEQLKDEWQDEVKRAKKANEAPRDLKYPLNNLPENTTPKKVSTKIYALRTDKKVPENILPATRTIYTEEQAKRFNLVWPGKPFEVAYMKWVKNPPKVKEKKGE